MLDIKEYAASLGIDINNINMTMVDKTMGDGSTDKRINGVRDGGGAVPVPPIPFLDTPLPWQGGGALAVIDAETVEEENNSESGERATVSKEDGKPLSAAKRFKDPIDSLTVVKLKKIPRKENLKVSGNKQELRDCLKTHVRSVLLEKKDDR